MLTYQDLLKVGKDENKRMEFALSVVSEHVQSSMYQEAEIAQEYMKQNNPTIRKYIKYLYSISGKAITDVSSSNHKMSSGYVKRLILSLVNFLLGNGITMDVAMKKKLGRRFDKRLTEMGKFSLIDGVCFGFWNCDHVDVFRVTQFAPIWDERTGQLMAGVRFWRIDQSKPMYFTLYEPDGYTELMVTDDNKVTVVQGKQAYVRHVLSSAADGDETVAWSNYAGFPIVPMWGNSEHQSEVSPLRADIDAYDLIKNGFANSITDIPPIYWTVYGAQGLDERGLAKFLDSIRRLGGGVVSENGANVTANTVDVPHDSRDSILDRIERDIYRNFMMLDTNAIASGADTATEVEAAYEPTNVKTDDFEGCVDDFVDSILALAGMEDVEYTFTRSMVVNTYELAQVLALCAEHLSSEYITTKLLTALGDGDKVEDVLKQMAAEELERMADDGNEDEDETEDMEAGRRASGNRTDAFGASGKN